MLKKNAYFFLVLLVPFLGNASIYRGIGLHPESFPGGLDVMFSVINELNFNSVRLDYSWSKVEKEKKIYAPPDIKTENTITIAVKNKLVPLIILGYGNELYVKKDSTNPYMKPNSKESRDAYVNYVSWTANHLKNKKVIFEVWNEWIQLDGKENRALALSKSSADSYVELVNQSCKEIKKIDSNSIVIAGSTSPFDSESNEWLYYAVKKGLLNCIDGISIHAYHYNTDKKILNTKEVLATLLFLERKLSDLSHKSEVPFYITEIGVPTIDGTMYNERDISIYYATLLNSIESYGFIKGLWWYDLIDDGNNNKDIEDNFGILKHDLEKKEIFNFMAEKKGKL